MTHFRILLTLLTALILLACGGGNKTTTANTTSTTGTVIPLFTSAHSSVSLTSGITANYTIGGGVPPYVASSSNSAVAAASVAGVNLALSGVGAGSSVIVILDSVGAKVEIAAAVAAGSAASTFFTNAPSTLSLTTAQTLAYGVSGGVPPYAASSSNPSVVNADISASTLTLTGSAAGNATVTLFDSTGARLTSAVTVGSAIPTVPFFTTAGTAVTLGIGGSSSYTIAGGTAPYSVSSSNTAAVAVSQTGVNGGTFTLTGGAVSGTAQVLVFDAVGAQLVIGVTVGSATAPALFTTAPSTLSMAEGASARTFTVGGGSPPYSVGGSNIAVADPSISGNTLTVTAGAAGSVELIVLDSTGAKVTIAVTVTGSSSPVSPLRTTAAAAIVLATSTNATFTISGGAPPYAVSSSNTGVATVGLASPNLTVSGIAAGAAQVLVMDSTGTQVTIGVTVGATPVTALSTSAPSTVTIASGSLTPARYTIFGGTPPYQAVSSNTAVLAAAVTGGSVLELTGITVGNANAEVIDVNGLRSSVVAVSVSALAGDPLSVTPGGATGNVGDVLTFRILGGTSPYTVGVSNASIATVSPASVAAAGDTFSATLLNVGNNIISVRDAQGQTASLALAVASTSPSVRLSPSAFTVAENNLDAIVLNIYGGTPPYRALTTELLKTGVPTGNIAATTLSPPTAILTTTVGTSNTRCINPVTDAVPPVYIPSGTYDVTFTVFDSLGASASSVMTIKDNGAGLNAGCAPSVSGLAITSATGIVGGNLTAGNVVTVTLTMSSATTVTGVPQLALNIGGTTVQSDYSGGSGTTALTFTYTILAGQIDSNGISINANSLSLNGGTLADVTGMDASLYHRAVTDNSNYRVNSP